MYSPAGTISYYNLSNGTQRARFSCEPNLTQPVLFANNLFLAGYKDGAIFIILATTGETLSRIAARNPLLISSAANFFYIELSGRNGTLNAVESNGTKISSPLPVKKFSLSENTTFTTGVSSLIAAGPYDTKLLFGTSTGSVYTTTTFPDTTTIALNRISQGVYQNIYDIIHTSENEFCFLTEKEVFISEYTHFENKKIADNTEKHTNMLSVEGGSIILWSAHTKKPFILLQPTATDEKKCTVKRIVTPANPVTSVRAFGTNIIIIEGNSTVNLYSTKTGVLTQLYIGTGIQDALLIADAELIIAKSAASNPPSPLISVDMATKETVRLPQNNDITYALIESNDSIYGVALSSAGNDRRTTLFSYNHETQSARTLLNYADEDVSAFTYIFESTLYTNIGKSNVIAYNILNRTQTQLERSVSLSKKVIRNKDFIAALGYDGSIAWYQTGSPRIISLWYLTTTGEWEFPLGYKNITVSNVRNEEPDDQQLQPESSTEQQDTETSTSSEIHPDEIPAEIE
jgi:hypothetical protein